MNSPHYRCLFAVIAVFFAPLCLPAAVTVTLQPDSSTANDGDTFVGPGPTNLLVNNNYGGAGALEISASGLAKGEFKGALRFDTSTAASTFNSNFGTNGWVIDSITLQLTVANPNNALFNANTAGQFQVQWLQSDNWIEGNGSPQAANSTPGALTWATLASYLAGAQSEGTFTYNGDAVGSQLQFLLTPTGGLTGDVLSGSQASFLLSAVGTGMSGLFNARNNGVIGNRPALIISASPTAVPEPSRALLVFAGAGCMVVRRRRNTQLL